MKMVNIVLGVATAIILGALINLGIKAFSPEPVAPTYPSAPYVAPCAKGDVNCETDQATYEKQQAVYQQQWQTYQAEENVYNKNLFIIANLIGILVFALGFWLIFGAKLSSHGVPIGIMLAGLWSIIYGYGRGWGSVQDQLKFFVGLVIAALMIGGSMWLIERAQKNKAN